MDIDPQFLIDSLVGRAAGARRAIAELESLLAQTTDDLKRRPLEDLILVLSTAQKRIAHATSEADVREVIREVRQLMGRGLDGGAFMTANTIIEDLRQLIGDTYVDTGQVSRSPDEAIAFLKQSLTEEEKNIIRSNFEASEDDDHVFFARWGIGQGIRNRLRSAGFTEACLDVSSLDDVWEELATQAVAEVAYRDSVGWLEALLVDAEDAGWCMSPYCTTCGCWDFRRAYWAAAARQVGIAHVFESPSHLRDILEGLSGAERESVVRALVGGLRQLPPIWIGSEGFQTIMKDLDPPLILHGVSMNLSTELDATPAGNYLRARRALAEREIAEWEERRVFDSREAIEERRRVKREEKAVAHARRQEETRQRNAERSELIAALALLTPVERISRFATDPGLHLDRVPVELIPTQERDLVALEKAEAVALLTRISRRRGAWGRLRRMLEHLLEDESESDT